MADKMTDHLEQMVIDLLYYANDTDDKKMAYVLRESAALIQVFAQAFRRNPPPKDVDKNKH